MLAVAVIVAVQLLVAGMLFGTLLLDRPRVRPAPVPAHRPEQRRR